MDTSGLIVVAISAASQRNLSMQFQRRETRKRYIALLEGWLEDERGTIELPFRLDVDNRPIDPFKLNLGNVYFATQPGDRFLCLLGAARQ